MSELDAATRMRPARAATLLLFSIIGLILFGLVWAGLSQIEEITRGQGQVVPSQDIQVVQSLEGGILSELLVQDGEKVSKNQILMRLSNVQFSSEERGTEARFLGLEAKKARLEAEAEGKDFIVPETVREKAPQVGENELALYASRQKELTNAYDILDNRISQARAEAAETQAQIARLTESRGHLKEELAITRQMVAKQAVPKLEQIRLERELGDINGQINANTEKKKGLEAELQVSLNERKAQENKFRSQALGDLSDVKTEMTALQENLKTIGDRVDRTDVRSPVDGIVNKIALKTIGGVIEPAMRLVEIVPLDDELKIVARVSPREIAFIRPGQDVKVKITAYDAQKYGSLHGKLVRIGANSVTDKEGNVTFEIEVRTDKNYMGNTENPLPITPGMVAEVEIITGKRSILDYLLKPVLRARDRALTER
ncbi:MAG: HlyD family type I secretion periplasmic adaptor subunit [Alphaproteobacteria bacterium]|nr:HlyD family type I secretion periplasmic adaptor subunit [Alphaproteobacteria bacterium]